MPENLPANWGGAIGDVFENGWKSASSAIEMVITFLSVSSIFIGFHGFFKTYIGFMLMGMNPDITACSIVFLISFSVYSLDKVADMNKDVTNMPQRFMFLFGRKKMVLFCAIGAYLLAIILVLLSKPIALPVVFIPFVANAFYATKVHKSIPRLKDIPGVKNIIVALAWAVVVTLIPALYMKGASTNIVVDIIYFMLIKTFVDNILYDIRDMRGDSENGVRTLPVLLGKRKIVVLLLIVNSTLLPWLALTGVANKLLALLLVIYGYAYIIYFRTRRNPMALDLFVEGEWMLMTILLLTTAKSGMWI